MSRFFALMVGLVVLSPVVHAETEACVAHKCMAVIDAGSSGSRLHIYEYDLDASNTPIQIHEIWAKKTKPGLSSVEANPATIEAYLLSVFAGSPTHPKIPVYFYATAGMRLVPESKQKLYYQHLKQWFTHQPQWQLMDAKTIPGTQEALYDWLSVNYLLGTLQSVNNESIGVMDMGGASVQIVFPVRDNGETNTKNQTTVQLYGQRIRLAVHSFLGLGQTEMSHQFLNSSSCYANEYPLPDGDLGLGNAYSCKQEVASLMNQVHKVNHTIQPLLAENPVDSWYSLGGISFLASDNIFHFKNNQLTSQDLLEQADNQVCKQSWGQLNSKHPNKEYLYQFCLFASYYYALLVDGYGLYPEQAIHYLPADEAMDWTIGVVLVH